MDRERYKLTSYRRAKYLYVAVEGGDISILPRTSRVVAKMKITSLAIDPMVNLGLSHSLIFPVGLALGPPIISGELVGSGCRLAARTVGYDRRSCKKTFRNLRQRRSGFMAYSPARGRLMSPRSGPRPDFPLCMPPPNGGSLPERKHNRAE